MKKNNIETKKAKKILDNMIGLLKDKKLTALSYEDGEIKIELKANQTEFKKESRGLEKKNNFKEGIVHVIKSHMVGIFHLFVNEEDEVSIKVKDSIEKGQIVGFIESMGLPHEVKSDFNGEIIEILAEEGSPVEYGEPLMKIKGYEK